VRKGGHDVPIDDIIRRYDRSKQNFWQNYRFLADAWQLYYNSDWGFDEVGAGAPDGFLVLRQREFDTFLQNVIDKESPK
jgi:predicted ABC-type ATPase